MKSKAELEQFQCCDGGRILRADPNAVKAAVDAEIQAHTAEAQRRRASINEEESQRPKMTIETKTTIQLSDVTAVEFTCKNCGRIITWPIGAAKVPTECDCKPPMQAGWMPYGGETYAGLMRLLTLIKQWGSANNETVYLAVCG